MGMNGLPEMYALALVLVCIFQANHVTTDIFHLGDPPASVGDY